MSKKIYCASEEDEIKPHHKLNKNLFNRHEFTHFDFNGDKVVLKKPEQRDSVDDVNPKVKSMRKSRFSSFVNSIVPESGKNILGYDIMDMGIGVIFFVSIIFYFCYFGTGLGVFIFQFSNKLNTYYLSMDPYSGYCTEVPKSINAVYNADDRGFWSTSPRFRFDRSIYELNANGLRLTNDDWNKALTAVASKLNTTALKGQMRDFAWNMVMWGSFAITVNSPKGGTMKFYANADSDVIFGENGDIVSAGFGNKFGLCQPAQDTTAVFDAGSKSFIISRQVCNDPPCSYQSSDYCVGQNDDGNSQGPNDDDANIPQKNILHPSQFGYVFDKTQNKNFEIQIDARSLTTALAVNLGLLSVNDLVQVREDDQIQRFKEQLIAKKILPKDKADNLFSFYDPLYAPMDPIYCMIYPNTLIPAPKVFEGEGDDYSYDTGISSLSAIFDDAIPTFAPSPKPIAQGSPTARPTIKQALFSQVVTIDLTFAPMSYDKFTQLGACEKYLNGSTDSLCPELSYLNQSFMSYLDPALRNSVSRFGVVQVTSLNISSSRRLDVSNAHRLGLKHEKRRMSLRAASSAPTPGPTSKPSRFGAMFTIYFILTIDKSTRYHL